MGQHWLITLHMIQVYVSIIYNLYIALCVTTQSLVSSVIIYLTPLPYSTSTHRPLSLWEPPYCRLYLCIRLFCLLFCCFRIDEFSPVGWVLSWNYILTHFIILPPRGSSRITSILEPDGGESFDRKTDSGSKARIWCGG